VIVVSNRVQVPDERVDTFLERLQTSHGIEEQSGFRELKLLAPVDAEGHVTMTFWDSLDDYEAWREGAAFERAHEDASADRAFARDNEVEVHEVLVEREPER
jgi:heme-degrading monooxygenase HmoA